MKYFESNPDERYTARWRVVDVACAAAALTILMPVIAAIAMAVLATSGRPVLFAQGVANGGEHSGSLRKVSEVAWPLRRGYAINRAHASRPRGPCYEENRRPHRGSGGPAVLCSILGAITNSGSTSSTGSSGPRRRHLRRRGP